MNAVVGAIEGIAGLGAATLGYSLLEAQAFTTRQVTVEVLPKGSADLKVLHLSDLHITPAQTRKIKWVRTLIELEPDLVVGTGDFLAHQLAVPALVEALGDLMDLPGLFVLGSNDYYEPYLKNPFTYFKKGGKGVATNVRLPTSDLVEQLTNAGWLDLNNKQNQLLV
jgi:predicted MPP superfamily phosphohydrolase